MASGAREVVLRKCSRTVFPSPRGGGRAPVGLGAGAIASINSSLSQRALESQRAPRTVCRKRISFVSDLIAVRRESAWDQGQENLLPLWDLLNQGFVPWLNV